MDRYRIIRLCRSDLSAPHYKETSSCKCSQKAENRIRCNFLLIIKYAVVYNEIFVSSYFFFLIFRYFLCSVRSWKEKQTVLRFLFHFKILLQVFTFSGNQLPVHVHQKTLTKTTVVSKFSHSMGYKLSNHHAPIRPKLRLRATSEFGLKKSLLWFVPPFLLTVAYSQKSSDFRFCRNLFFRWHWLVIHYFLLLFIFFPSFKIQKFNFQKFNLKNFN